MAGKKCKPGTDWKSYSKTEIMSSLLEAIQFIPSLAMGYNDDCRDQCHGSCQDTMMFTSYPVYTRIMSKINCPAKF